MKLDINDKLFSELKRGSRTNCQRCGKQADPKGLHCCHIFSRKYYSTRFDPENAVVLCFSCHSWFDTHKMTACFWDSAKRVFTDKEESFHFLVKRLGYTWDQLIELCHKSQVPFKGYKAKKKDISKYLRGLIKEQEGIRE